MVVTSSVPKPAPRALHVNGVVIPPPPDGDTRAKIKLIFQRRPRLAKRNARGFSSEEKALRFIRDELFYRFSRLFTPRRRDGLWLEAEEFVTKCRKRWLKRDETGMYYLDLDAEY